MRPRNDKLLPQLPFLVLYQNGDVMSDGIFLPAGIKDKILPLSNQIGDLVFVVDFDDELLLVPIGVGCQRRLNFDPPSPV